MRIKIENKNKKHMIRSLVVALGLSAVSLSALAVQKPLKLASDGRIEVVPYEQNNVVPVYGTPFTSTQIIFGQSQVIASVQGGDAGGWTPNVDKNIPNVLNLKLAAQSSNSNMTVITKDMSSNKLYYYYFHLQSVSSDNQRQATYAIRFLYPQVQAQKLQQALIDKEHRLNAEVTAFKNPGNYNWAYTFSGDKSIMPIHVFDDGKFTYMDFIPGTPLPAVFVVDNTDGHEAVVNFRRDGNFLVIQRTAPQFTLREGSDHVASIFNTKLVNHMSGKDWS